MADTRLTKGNDVYVQPEAEKAQFASVFGDDGDDAIRIYLGNAWGQRGNDRIERILDPANPFVRIGAIYFDSPAGIHANLIEGWADDGWGTRDTLVGIYTVHGSRYSDRFVGDANDNYFVTSGGDDVADGGAGNDGLSLEGPVRPDASKPSRQALLSDLDIRVSPDGRQASFKVAGTPVFSVTATDFEYFEIPVISGGPYVRFSIADYITPQSMAEQAIAAGGAMRWNAAQALGTSTPLSFSFVTQSTQPGFRAFTATEQQAVRDILAKTAQIAGLTFAEVTESTTTVGQLRFGVSQQAASKGQAALPGTQGDAAGDVWMDVESMLNLTPGSEGYAALLHEIGHALGLRHPRNTDPGENWPMQLRPQDDRPSMTVMSSQSSADGLFRTDWGVLDVLALRYLYGTRMTNTGDTTYRLGERESAAQVTVVDDGGSDTLDASALASGVNLDLVPGHLGSAGLTSAGFAGVENLGIAVGTQIEKAVGTAFDDVLIGNDANNTLTGGLGNDWIEGGNGIDTAIFAGKRSDYLVSNDLGKVFVEARDGVSGFDSLLGIELLQFADQFVTLATSALGADGQYNLDEDSGLTSSLPDPTDVARSKASYTLVGTALHGSAQISVDGQFTYTPALNYAGPDVLTFDLTSGTTSNRYQAYINVRPINDGPPVAKDTTLLAPAGATLRAALPKASDIDGDPITYAATANAKNGEVVVASDGTFRYTPKAAFEGTDAFTFIVGDGLGGTNTYTATLVVVPVAVVREGTEAADTLAAQTSADGYIAYGGNDKITGGGGNDLIDGGAGIDTAIYLSGRGLYNLAKTDYGWTISANGGNEGSDIITNVERLQFTNMALALDLDGNAGSVAQIIRALFGKDNLANKLFVGVGLQLFDAGMAYADVVKLALGTDIFAELAGGRSNTAFVNFVYKNVIGVAPSATELSTYAGLLDAGVYTQDSLALAACQISFNTGSVELTGLAATGIEFTPQT